MAGHAISKDKPAVELNGTLLREGYDFSNSSISNITQRRFNFGPRDSQSVSVDQTLAHLFDTLSVECSGILVHPQWKHFRHIRMLKNDQIRLSNGIWRSWHLQFQKKKAPLYCWFDIEPKLDHHKGQEAVVLEGKYWKRRSSAVAEEYRKWRFYREKNVKKPCPSLDGVREKAAEIFYELTNEVRRKPQEMQVDPSRPLFLQSPEDFTANLFQSNAREPLDAYSAYDMMVQQPNLDMLNPMLDDFLNRLSEPMDIMMGKPTTQSTVVVRDGETSSQSQNPAFAAPTSSQQQQQQQQGAVSYSSHPSQQASIPMQLSVDNLQTSLFSSLGGYQDVRMADQPRYSPSSFLGLNQSKGEEGLLDLPQVANVALKCESSVENQLTPVVEPNSSQNVVYQTTGTPTFQPDYSRGDISCTEMYQTQQQRQVNDRTLGSMLDDFYQSEGNSVVTYQHGSGHHTPQGQGSAGTGGSFPFPATSPLTSPPPTSVLGNQQQGKAMLAPFIRVSSAGELSMCTSVSSATRPPLERGSSEPIKHLESKVRDLSAQHLKQMEELDKQKNLAEVQYSELLMQFLPQQTKVEPSELQQQRIQSSLLGSGVVNSEEQQQQALQNALLDPSLANSEQQQQALRSVLTDPNLVKILRSFLLSTQPNSQQVIGSPSLTPIPGHTYLQPQSGSNSSTPPPSTQAAGPSYTKHIVSPPSVLSPTQLAKATGVSEFQSRILVAAVSSGITDSSNFPTPISSPSTITTSSLPSLPMVNDSDNSDTQTMMKKFKNSRHLSSTEKEVYREIRRQSHISAEQKRRGSIKQGFDHLQSLVINTSSYPSGKVSKAAILEKTLEHIQTCHRERDSREQQMESLKDRIEKLNAAINICQEQLPASGAPITRQRFEENRQRFRTYVQKRTLQNYKFWIFSIILQQLFESYNSMVSIGTVDELCRTVLAWFEQNCTLPSLRPIVLNSLKELSQKTSILSDPSQVPRQLSQYAQQLAQQQDLRTRRQRQQQQHALDMNMYS